MVHRTEFQINSVPTVRVTSGLSVIIMAWNPYIQVTRRFCRREYREEHRYCAPVGEEMTLIVMRPGVRTERVVPLQTLREGELVALGRQLAQPSLLSNRGGTGGCEQPSRRRSRLTCTAECFPNVALAAPVGRVLPA